MELLTLIEKIEIEVNLNHFNKENKLQIIELFKERATSISDILKNINIIKNLK